MEWIIRSRKDTGIVVEIMALGSSPCAPHVSVKMRQGFAGQNCHSRALKREREKGLSPLLPQIRLPCQQYVTGISFPTLLLLQRCSTAAKDGDEV